MSVKIEQPWVLRTGISHADIVAQFRQTRDLKVLVDGDLLWLRGNKRDVTVDTRIRSIPDAEFFDIQPDASLTRLGETVPCARLPGGTWQFLGDWISLKLPQTGFAAPHNERVMLTLVRSSSFTDANVLETNWKTWFAYAISAPRIRLNPLGFALGYSVLIRGNPLPPISGRRYFESHGIIVPTGLRFEPDVGPIVVGQVLGLDEDEFALFSDDGSFERVPRSAFVQASRSSVRASNHE